MLSKRPTFLPFLELIHFRNSTEPIRMEARHTGLLAPMPLALKPRPRKRKLYVDLDGVLADFDRGVHEALGVSPDSLHPRDMWPALARVPGGFFRTLAPMSDASLLWAHCNAFESVSILSGVPMGKWAEPQKRLWCQDFLGLSGDRIIICLARDKYKFCSPGAVLVDDRITHQEAWECAGGTFILHVDAKTSITRLKELGFT